jgi:hypothetical protein
VTAVSNPPATAGVSAKAGPMLGTGY